MGFDAPWVLLFLTGVPLFVLLSWLRWRHVRRVRQQFGGGRRIGNVSGRLQLVTTLALLVVGSASLIIAAAEPHVVREQKREIYKKRDLVFLLDTSLSMRARDIAPNRIVRASQEIQNFLRYHREYIGRVGLVSFSNSSIVLSYLTSDPSNIFFFLEHLSADAQPGSGTDIGAGISSGLSLLDKERAIDPSLEAGNLLFVLISDGEDYGEKLKEAVQRSSNAGVRIYTVGIGTEMGDYIPVGEEEGRTVFLTDEEGKQILANFDEGTLQWVAESTGGKYFRSRSGDELQGSLGTILQGERMVVDVDTSAQKIPLHWWFLTMGFATLAIRMIW